MLRYLKNLKPKDATLAVLGNHDHWIGADEIRKVMAETGIIELENDVYTIKRGDAQLNIAGIDSVTLDKHDLNAVLNKLPESWPCTYYWPTNLILLMSALRQVNSVCNYQDIHMVVR